MTKHPALLAALALAGACAAPPTLGTTDQPIVVTPSLFNFGSIDVGDTAPERIITVSPSSIGFDDDFIDSIDEACDDFDLDLSLLDSFPEVYRRCSDTQNPDLFVICPGGWEIVSQQFGVIFHPSFAGPQSCPVTVQLQNAGPRTVNLSGTGVAPPIAMTIVAPAGDLAFGDVVVGAPSSPLPVTIRNDGTEPLDLIDATLSGPDAVAFVATPQGSGPLGQGETLSWSVTCTPPGPGPLSATLTITSNAPEQSIGVSCNGIQSNLTITPSPVQFAETLIGSTSDQTVNLGNTGTAPLTITSTQIVSGPFTAPDLAGTDVPPFGVEVPLTIQFTPALGDLDTDVRGALLVTFEGGAESRTIDLVGPARDATLSLTPSGSLEFGTVCAGQPADKLFVALNSGSGGVYLSDAVVSGPGFGLVPIAPSTFPAWLPAHGSGSSTFRVTAAPALGDAAGEVTVTTEIPGREPTVVALHAIGLDRGVGASPDALDFGAVVVDESAGGQTIRITNCDGARLELTSATVTGADAADFLVVPVEQDVPGGLDSGATALFAVDLRPSKVGDEVATFELVHGAGTTAIPLTGTGVGEELPGGGGDRGSYYACDAGRGGGAAFAPIAGALALLLRRRRR